MSSARVRVIGAFSGNQNNTGAGQVRLKRGLKLSC